VIRHLFEAIVGDPYDPNAELSGSRDIDVVDSDAIADDPAKARSRGKCLPAYWRELHEERVGPVAGDRSRDVVLIPTALDGDLDVRCLRGSALELRVVAEVLVAEQDSHELARPLEEPRRYRGLERHASGLTLCEGGASLGDRSGLANPGREVLRWKS
jgi:hypothetical protein